MAYKILIKFFMLCICVWQAHAVVNCTSTGAGRYADPADTTCKNYSLCILQPTTNTYLSYDYVCPTTSLFSPTLRQCTTSYTCPVTTTTTSTTPSTTSTTTTSTTPSTTTSTTTSTTPSTTTTTTTSTTPSTTTSTTPSTTNGTTPSTASNNTNTTAATCTTDGFVADPSSDNCTSYIQCVSINGTFDQTTFTCPPTTFYNPNTTLCDSTYVCPAPAFTCTAAGRFADTSDATCESYYFCVALANSTLVEYQYTCPSSSAFDPASGLCTATYTCSN